MFLLFNFKYDSQIIFQLIYKIILITQYFFNLYILIIQYIFYLLKCKIVFYFIIINLFHVNYLTINLIIQFIYFIN